MRPLLLLVLCACGPTPYLEPVQTDALVQRSSSAPIDCVSICEHVKPQLIRDFGVPANQIDCWAPDFATAHDCPACQKVFQMKYGVGLTACP